MLNRSEAELKSVQLEMLDLAVPLYEKIVGYPPKIRSHDEHLNVIEKVLDSIADDHVERHEVVESARATIDELNQFIIDKDLLTLDPTKPLEIRETPEYQRGLSIASLQALVPWRIISKPIIMYHQSPTIGLIKSQNHSYGNITEFL